MTDFQPGCASGFAEGYGKYTAQLERLTASINTINTMHAQLAEIGRRSDLLFGVKTP